MDKVKPFKSEIKRVKINIDESENKLNNPRFIEHAGTDKVQNEKNKVRDFKANLNLIVSDNNRKLEAKIGEPFISYFIEEIRFNKYDGELFSEDYFNNVNMDNILDEEKEELLYLYQNDKLLELFNQNYYKISEN